MKTLRSYQQQAVDFALGANSAVILPYGTGKTLVGTHVLGATKGPGLVIAPKRVKEQWVSTLQEQFPEVRVHTDPSNVLSYAHNVLVTHYEQFVRDQWLQEFPWAAVVLDEAHRIKNPKAKRTVAIKKIKTGVKLALTATPLHKSVHDLWSILNWLDAKSWRSRRRFFDRYVVVETNFMGWQTVTGSRNLKELAELTKNNLFVRNIEQVAPELPVVMEQVLEIPMTRAQAAVYKRIDDADDIVVDDMLIPNALAKMTRLQQISSYPPLLGYDVDSGKLAWVKDFLEDQEEQVILFTRFRGMAEAIRNLFPSKFGVVVGGAPPEGVEDFKRGAKQFLVGTIASMSEGLDFPNATTAVFVDTVHSQIQMAQAAHRHQRISNPVPKNVIYLLSSGVDQDVFSAFKTGRSEIDMVMKYLASKGVSHRVLSNS